jgi:DNA-binding beta-propeller fold protein YncE
MRNLVMAGCLAVLAAFGVAGEGSHASAFRTHAPPARYRITRVPLPGDGRGDYILADPDARRLYVTHSASVHILNLDTLRVTGEVTGLLKAHGVAIAGGKGFASDGQANAVIVFDPATGRTLNRIATGQNPDAILFDRASGMVFAFNGGSRDISIIDPAGERVVRTMALGDKPETARSDGRGRIFVNLEEQHAIAVIDSRAGRVVARYVLPDCEGPAALDYDAAHRRLFSGCGNGVMKVVDSGSGRIVATLPVSQDPDGISYDPARRRLYVAGRDGHWTIIDHSGPDRYAVNRILRIDEYAKTTALDPRTGRVFSSTADLVWPPGPHNDVLPNARPGTFRLLVVSGR